MLVSKGSHILITNVQTCSNTHALAVSHDSEDDPHICECDNSFHLSGLNVSLRSTFTLRARTYPN